MPDLWVDVDIALAEVPVNIMPLLDDTDFKSIEASVAYNAAGMALKWNFVTTGGAMSQTAVTPTTSGDYDWVSQGNGIYSLEIPASGGASINNDTEGFGWFTGVATGVLPWRGPTIGFRAAGLNDKLIDSAYSATRALAGTALPDAAAEAAGGLYTRGTGAGQINQPANGMVDVNAVRLLGTAFATPATAGVIDVNVKNINNVVAATPGAAGGVFIAGTNAATTITTSLTTTFTGNLTGSVGSVTGNVGGNVTGSVGSVVGNVGGNVTGSVGSVVADVGITQAGADKVFGASGAAMAELSGVPSATPNPRAAVMLPFMALRNKLTTSATEKTISDDAGATIATKALSDSGLVYTEDEMA